MSIEEQTEAVTWLKGRHTVCRKGFRNQDWGYMPLIEAICLISSTGCWHLVRKVSVSCISNALLLKLKEKMPAAKDTIGSESLQATTEACRRSLGLLTQMRRQVWLTQIPLSELGRGLWCADPGGVNLSCTIWDKNKTHETTDQNKWKTKLNMSISMYLTWELCAYYCIIFRKPKKGCTK